MSASEGGRRLAVGVLVLALLASALIPVDAQAQEPDAETVRLLIIDRAAAHGADAGWMLATAWCESRFRPSARGSSGERGVFQWIGRGAWSDTLAARQGVPHPAVLYDRGEVELGTYFDVDAAAEMFSRGARTVRQHWSCAR